MAVIKTPYCHPLVLPVSNAETEVDSSVVSIQMIAWSMSADDVASPIVPVYSVKIIGPNTELCLMVGP